MKTWWLAVGLAGLAALRAADAPVSPPNNAVPKELQLVLPRAGRLVLLAATLTAAPSPAALSVAGAERR